MMLRVGLTGGIGSGKSTVAKIFEVLNIPIFYADIEAKKIMSNDILVIQKIKALLGEESYKNGAINTPYISKLVFNDKKLLNKLNQIIHPTVQLAAINWHKNQINTPYTLYEAALIYETHTENTFDKIIVVFANKKTCIKRVQQRNKLTIKAIKARMKEQTSPLLKKKEADYVVKNNLGDRLIQQVLDIHKELINISHNQTN